MKRLFFLCLFVAGGCLNTACVVQPMPASDLFQTSNPKLEIKKGLFGFKASAGSNFTGSLKADYDPITGAIHIDGQIASDVSGVVTAEGQRLAMMESQRLADINRAIVQEQMRSAERVELYKTIGAVVPLLAQSMGPGPPPESSRQPLGNTLSPTDFDSIRSEIEFALRSHGLVAPLPIPPP